MLTGNQDFTPKFLQIKQDDKFFSRLLSKEKNSSSVAGDSSFRVSYYGGAAGSVPFLWESQPGTPKHTFSDNPLPPLTPPPSYKFIPNNSMQKNNTQNSKMFSSIIPRSSSKKINISPSSSSCSSSSYSAPSTPMNWPSNTRKYSKASSTSAIHSGLYEEGHESISPTSTSCFSNRNGCSGKIRRQYYSMKSMKRAFLSIVGYAN